MDNESTDSHPYSRYAGKTSRRGQLSHSTLAEAAEERSHGKIIVTHQLAAPRDITHVMRSQFTADKDGGETTTGDLDVQVQIEQAVMVDYDYRQEDYRKPRVIWDRKPETIKEDNERTSGEQNQWELSSVKSVSGATDTV